MSFSDFAALPAFISSIPFCGGSLLVLEVAYGKGSFPRNFMFASCLAEYSFSQYVHYTVHEIGRFSGFIL